MTLVQWRMWIYVAACWYCSRQPWPVAFALRMERSLECSLLVGLSCTFAHERPTVPLPQLYYATMLLLARIQSDPTTRFPTSESFPNVLTIPYTFNAPYTPYIPQNSHIPYDGSSPNFPFVRHKSDLS